MPLDYKKKNYALVYSTKLSRYLSLTTIVTAILIALLKFSALFPQWQHIWYIAIFSKMITLQFYVQQ